MMRRAAALLVMLALPALANITTSSLTGRVIIGDAPASGVTVNVTSAALREPRTTTTNAHGRYWLGALPPGVYDVTFSLPGHTTLTKRAVLELARVARADAMLEVNPDEDSTTSTAVTVSVADTIPITTHFDDRSLDRLPTGRVGSASLAPGGHQYGSVSTIDGVPFGAVTSEETIEQMTIVRGATPVEWEAYFDSAVALRTRSGGDDLSFTLRDTITDSDWNSKVGTNPGSPEPDDDLMHFGEATAGGPIVPQRLWFFAGAWRGEQASSANVQTFDGVLAKIDARLGRQHHLALNYRDTSHQTGLFPYDSDTAALHYTAVAGSRFTSEVLAARTEIGADVYEVSTEFLSARASYVLGDHVVTAGLSNDDGAGPSYASFYASDRWSVSRWNVYAGLRHDDSELIDRWSPRVAISYDFRGNGTQAISASWGEYAIANQPANTLRVSSLGYATAIGTSGSARADVIRRESGNFWQNELQLDARYRLFDRFEAGATYTLANRSGSFAVLPEQVANVWLGAELPVGNHEFGVTLLQHYIDGFGLAIVPTDLALRYAIPFSRLGLIIAADATNVFDDHDAARAVRLWVRVGVK
ncbi:MAG: carboxypeptidase regulatory-like domain-containing protein [Thermoanaerobaculia bacterium]